MLKIRLTTRGRKANRSYRVVVMESKQKRDGRAVDDLGFYSPKLPADHENRLQIDGEKAKQWIERGAKPTDTVSLLLAKKGIISALPKRNNPIKGRPKAKAQQRIKEAEELLMAQQKSDAAGEGMVAAS